MNEDSMEKLRQAHTALLEMQEAKEQATKSANIAAAFVEKVKRLYEKKGDKLSLRQHMRDEAIRLIKALTGATPADMDKIRCSGLSIDFCIEAAKTGLSAPEILKLGRTGVSLSNFLYMRRVLNASTEPAPGADHQPPQPAL